MICLTGFCSQMYIRQEYRTNLFHYYAISDKGGLGTEVARQSALLKGGGLMMKPRCNSKTEFFMRAESHKNISILLQNCLGNMNYIEMRFFMRKLIQIVLINHAWNMQRTVAWFKIERGIIYLKLKNAWL